MLSWFFADACRLETARERRIVAWSGLAPDFDVLAYAGAIVYYQLDKDMAFEKVWSVVHHRYTHGIAFILLTGIVAWLLARGPNRARVVLLAVAASALHNFLDVVAGGPTWPIYPVWPMSDFKWHASWSWTIGEWPNIVILFACLAAMLLYARYAGRSPLECFGGRADAWLVRVVRQESTQTSSAKDRARRWIIWTVVALIAIAILAPLGFNPLR